MTIPKKGSRAIVVDGRALRYSVLRKGVRGCPDCDRIHIVIAADDRKGSVVHIHVERASGPDVMVTPRTISRAAKRALEKGWRPGEGTGVFLALSLREVDGSDESAGARGPRP
jgi:hypothetical protein